MEPIKCQEEENRFEDLKFAAGYSQNYFATLQTTNVLIQNPTGLENNKILAKQVDTIAMLGHVNTQLTQLRRDEIKPSLQAEYSAICSAEVPITSPYLFGEDLAK